jgi:RNA polymerase sigma-70 factor (ECF subfamily)
MSETGVLDSATQGTLVRSAARGDEVAFARLVAEHHPSMMRVAWVIVDDPDAALDAVQSAWSIAWRQLPRLREPERVGSWLVAIAANEARGTMRRRRRQRASEIAIDPGDPDEPAAPAGSDPASGIGAVDLDRVLASLDPEERRLLALRYVAGYDSSEMGRLLGTSASGVRSRLARLLDKVRKELDR